MEPHASCEERVHATPTADAASDMSQSVLGSGGPLTVSHVAPSDAHTVVHEVDTAPSAQ